MQHSKIFLLTFSSFGPDIGPSHLRSVGGFRLDQCYATAGVRHRFLLLVLGRELDGLRSIERFMMRLGKEYGAVAGNLSGNGSVLSNAACRKGQTIWTHPGYRVMVDRQRRMDPCLKAWVDGRSIPCSHRLLLRCWDVDYTLWRKKLDLRVGALMVARHATARIYSKNSASPVKRESVDFKDEDVVLSSQSGPFCKTEPVDAVPPPQVGHRRKRSEEDSAAPPPPYQYVRRENDDRWTMGWV